MSDPTLHTLIRWLTPWRTIRRLEAENQALVDTIANPTLTGIAIHDGNATFNGFGPGPELLAGMFLGLLKEHPEAVNYLEITYGSNQGPVIVTVQRPSGASPRLAAIRPVMKEHGIRTSEFPPAVPAPAAAPTPPPTALVELVGNELPLLPDGRVDEARARAAISKMAAWLDSQGHQSSANVVRWRIDG
jgi:hypothetical protein